MSTQSIAAPTPMNDRHRRLQTALHRLGTDAPAAAPPRWALDRAARVIADARRPVRVLIPFAADERLAA